MPISGYVADFVCPQAKLIIELDGGQHLDQMEYDARRTSVLEALGYKVLRYWNDDVLLRADDVAADIHRHLTAAFTPPQPSGPTGRSSPHELPLAVRKRGSLPPSLREREGANSNSNTDTFTPKQSEDT